MSFDPTAIPIRFDPLSQRMSGTAFHGHTDFDVPFISKITDDLWQGGCEKGLVLPGEVDHLVSLYPWEHYSVEHELQSALVVRLFDSAVEPNREQMIAIARWINICRRTGITLVHCQAGLNRSSLLAGLALILDGMKPGEAVELLRRRRSPAVLCNATFERWLLSFDGD